MTNELDWLRDANAQWQSRAEAAKARADSAEKWAYEERQRRIRAERKWLKWRTSYAFCFVMLGAVSLHWPRWLVFAVPIGAVFVVEAVQTVRVWRRQRGLTRTVRKRSDGAS